jgi:hypothetical protein
MQALLWQACDDSDDRSLGSMIKFVGKLRSSFQLSIVVTMWCILLCCTRGKEGFWVVIL